LFLYLSFRKDVDGFDLSQRYVRSSREIRDQPALSSLFFLGGQVRGVFVETGMNFSRQVLISCFPDFMFNDTANQQLRRGARDQIKEYQKHNL
jgi:hypothetical protein